jgi:sugar (pentulose or hexulose) kinase
MLLIPDLLAYWLTGEPAAESTNARTTQLLDAPRQLRARRRERALGRPVRQVH